MQSFTDLPSLDKYLERLDAAAKVSDDELRSLFNGFEWRRDPTVHGDPYSLAFRNEQMDLYCKLAGVSSYDTANERSHFDVAEAVRRPFPYLTGSSHTVGDHLIGIGFLLKTANLKPESRVLEFGPGWGNTTLALAQFGCRVTAVDIESNFVDLIRRRLTAVGLDVESVQGDFNVFCDSGRQFDAVVFFESFHHCGDHLKLLRSLEHLVAPDGVVVFGAEPITDTFPVPWGVRLDGMSVWSIRRFRWLELGYQESYFTRTLMRFGWVLTKHVTEASSIGTVYLARRFHGKYDLADLLLPPDEDVTWAPAEKDATVGVRHTAGNSQMVLDDNLAWRRATVDVINSAPFTLRVWLDAGAGKRPTDLNAGQSASLEVALGNAPRTLTLHSQVWSPLKLGLNSDARSLGFAVSGVQLHER